MAGALGGANKRPAPRAPGRPGPRPGGPGFARVTVFGSPALLFCPGLTRGLGWHARESSAGAARRARATSRACAWCLAHCSCARTRAALAHMPRLREYARGAGMRRDACYILSTSPFALSTISFVIIPNERSCMFNISSIMLNRQHIVTGHCTRSFQQYLPLYFRKRRSIHACLYILFDIVLITAA